MKQSYDIDLIRHSLAHVMALAFKRLYKDALFGVGPTIENGFYYDVDSKEKISSDDLEKIEDEMKKIIKEDLKFDMKEVSIKEAKKIFKDQSYKLELIKDIEKYGTTVEQDKGKASKTDKVTIYTLGEFIDLCRGPHVGNTKDLPTSFKLIRISGAYWRGDEKNPMLQRLYAIAFNDPEELELYLKNLEEAEKRDHRKLGAELELFLVDPMVGMGLVMWQPKGALIWRIMEEFWYKEHLRAGYELVRTPHIGSRSLWETSGHWGFYSDSMYPVLEVGQSLTDAKAGKKAKIKEEYLLKPMNCPFHVMIYKSKIRSYRNLPLRWAECGTVYRYEKSGELTGLIRVRGFTQDDAHIICTKDQVKDELKRVIDFIIFIFSTFGFKDYKIHLSLRDPKNKTKYAGHDEGWEFTEAVLEEVAKEKKLDYTRYIGEAAFYGPKLDFHIKDCLGREWQCSTLQFDFNLPEKFDMNFVNQNGQLERPYMLHRALFGSFERFVGLLIEHYAGAFPLWLSPIQLEVVPIGKAHKEYANEVAEKLKQNDFRVEVSDDNETVNKRIRDAEAKKIPYILVVGDKEKDVGSVAVRKRHKGDLGQKRLDDFIPEIIKERDNKVTE